MSSRRKQNTKICFVHAEPDDRAFFREQLDGRKIVFVSSLEDVPEDAQAVSVFITERVDAKFLDAHPDLKLVASRSSGSDHIDLEACKTRGIVVRTVGGYGEHSVAEHTFALILALSRRLRESQEAMKSGHFSVEGLCGFDLRGKTLGVVGAGRIGLRVIRIGRSLGMRVIASDENPRRLSSDLLDFEYVPIEQLFKESRVISLHLPLNNATRHVVNERMLARCQPGTILINTARGALMDIHAVIRALDEGRLGGVGLDVLEDERIFQGGGAASVLSAEIAQRVRNSQTAVPRAERQASISQLVAQSHLAQRKDVILTPHVAYNSIEAREHFREVTLTTLRDFLAGKLSA